MAVFAYMVTKNEADRYLSTCLDQLTQVVDGVAVYDDQSTDDTVWTAKNFGCEVEVRPDGVPSFLAHEGKFRQAAWNFVERTFALTEDDWVLAIDADEFLLDVNDVPRETLQSVTSAAARATSVSLKIYEVFGFSDGVPLIRIDGYWDKIAANRLVRYEPGGVFKDSPMASGSEPTYASRSTFRNSKGLYLLHYGYADRKDQVAKYERYSARGGHSNRHVESIIRLGHMQKFTLPHIESLVRAG